MIYRLQITSWLPCVMHGYMVAYNVADGLISVLDETIDQ